MQRSVWKRVPVTFFVGILCTLALILGLFPALGLSQANASQANDPSSSESTRFDAEVYETASVSSISSDSEASSPSLASAIVSSALDSTMSVASNRTVRQAEERSDESFQLCTTEDGIEYYTIGYKGLADAFGGITRPRLLNYLQGHEFDDYFLGTRFSYEGSPSTSMYPNGSPRWDGYTGLNCAGFIAYTARAAGANLDKLPGWPSGANNWYYFARNNGVRMYYFWDIPAFQRSGLAEKGDIVYYTPRDWSVPNADNHIAWYWGENGRDIRTWHSIAKGNLITWMYLWCDDMDVYLIKMDSPGSLKIAPKSANPEITDENPIYGFEGATYGLWRYKSDASGMKAGKRAYTLTTNASGTAFLDNVTTGRYYLRQIEPADGYELDSTIYTITVNSGKMTTSSPKLSPKPDPGPLGDNIERIAGDTRYDTSVSVSMEAFPDGANAVVLARGNNYKDSMSASGLAGVLDAPILLTEQKQLTPQTKAEIQRLGASEVYIIGGTAAITQAVENAVKKIPGVTSVKRIYGKNASETSVKCAREIEILVAESASATDEETQTASIEASADAYAAAKVDAGDASGDGSVDAGIAPNTGNTASPDASSSLGSASESVVAGEENATAPSSNDVARATSEDAENEGLGNDPSAKDTKDEEGPGTEESLSANKSAAPSDSLETAQISTNANRNPESVAIVATSTSFKDAASISSYAYKYHLPIFIVSDKSSKPATSLTLSSDAKEMLDGYDLIIATGGTTALPTTSLEKVHGTYGEGGKVLRLGGETGYETSCIIAQWLYDNGKMTGPAVGVASGRTESGGADALSSASLCAKNNAPLILCDFAGTAAGVDGFIKARSVAEGGNLTNAYVFGGTSAIGRYTYGCISGILRAP